MTEIPLITRARAHGSAVAFQTDSQTWTYDFLLERSELLARALLQEQADLQEARVALLVPAGAEYVAAQWGIWRAGGIMLPLCLSATLPEWEYALTDAKVSIVIASLPLADKLRDLTERLGIRLLIPEQVAGVDSTEVYLHALPEIDPDRRAMILYTSGTTSRPKGVVTTHENIRAQIESLVEAWEWQATDRIPLFLPLHHIHGIINVTCCALWSGALIEPFSRFDLPAILRRVQADAYTLFMAVPTIYVKLIEALHALPPTEFQASLTGFSRLRLMVSGSAALPASVHDEWYELTGQKLLERYGMTEIGMALSNPYHGDRRPGMVGIPLPGVEVRLLSEAGELITEEAQPGEIQVRGPGVFREYWNRPEITAESFCEGWFRTGDVAQREDGYYRILGRQSVDIIKSGGYKLSALEIEAVLLEHPAIRECAVVGVADETWGEAVAAAAVLHPDHSLDLPTLRDWCRHRLSVYKIPKQLNTIPTLPRNAMGKVTKPALRDLFQE